MSEARGHRRTGDIPAGAVLTVLEAQLAADRFARNRARQGAGTLNVQRACEAALDMGQHLVRRERLGIPRSARDIFDWLWQGGWATPELADGLKRMAGFRNVAVHDAQKLLIPIVVSIVAGHLGEFLAFSKGVLLKGAQEGTGR